MFSRSTNALLAVIKAVSDSAQRVGTRFTGTTEKGYTMHALPSKCPAIRGTCDVVTSVENLYHHVTS